MAEFVYQMYKARKAQQLTGGVFSLSWRVELATQNVVPEHIQH